MNRQMKVLAIWLVLICISLVACEQNPDHQVTADAEQSGTSIIQSCGDKDLHIHEVVLEGDIDSYKIFYISDSHISICDNRDETLLQKASERTNAFSSSGELPQEVFDRLIDVASNSDADLVILGGDIIDSAMYASIDYVGERLSKLNKPYIYLMGNHDFEYGSEYFSPIAYEEYLPRLQDIHGSDSYQIREEEDVIVLAIDDSNNQISVQALEAFKQIIKKEKPIILALHVPIESIYENDTLVQQSKEVWGSSDDDKSRVTIGLRGIYPNETTREFLDLVYGEESKVTLILAGHVHFYNDEKITDVITQVVSGAAYEGEAVMVELTNRR